MSNTAFRRLWEKILNKLRDVSEVQKQGLIVKNLADDITPHIFRHTYGTMLYYAGVDIKTAQYLLGHSSIQMTMDIYTHLDNTSNIIAADKLNKFTAIEKQS